MNTMNRSSLDPYREDLVTFTGGTFTMGSETGAPAEQPAHVRNVAPFALDRRLVTNDDFRAFVNEAGHITTCEERGFGWALVADEYQAAPGVSWRTFADRDSDGDHPVVLVSWRDATAYASWAGKRLPMEAEWEFAARAATGFTSAFPWSETLDPFQHCGAGRAWIERPGTSPVGRWMHGEVSDLVGNVWQWCADPYSDDAYDAYGSGKLTSAISAADLRVRRGGAWNVRQAFRLRCSNRGAYPEGDAAPNIGFRCAVSV